MRNKILTWEDFRNYCMEDAQLWHDQGYQADELTEDDILNEYGDLDEYFNDEYDDDLGALYSNFTPEQFAAETLADMRELEEVIS